MTDLRVTIEVDLRLEDTSSIENSLNFLMHNPSNYLGLKELKRLFLLKDRKYHISHVEHSCLDRLGMDYQKINLTFRG